MRDVLGYKPGFNRKSSGVSDCEDLSEADDSGEAVSGTSRKKKVKLAIPSWWSSIEWTYVAKMRAVLLPELQRRLLCVKALNQL